PEAGRVRIVKKTADHAPLTVAGAEISLQAVPARFEDGFMTLFRAAADDGLRSAMPFHGPRKSSTEVVVEVHDLVRTFGGFVAVDHVSFQVRRGEIFGLLGPNGAGKSTTFRMLCGLLPASGGALKVAGADLRTSRAEARQRLGYVAQKFSLYGQLSVD